MTDDEQPPLTVGQLRAVLDRLPDEAHINVDAEIGDGIGYALTVTEADAHHGALRLLTEWVPEYDEEDDYELEDVTTS